MTKKSLCILLAVCMVMPLFAITAFAQEVTATKTESAITLDGEVKPLEAYNIDGSNYFKLRDVAYILSGTPKQFDVTYDTEKKAISLATNTPYTTVGGEMETNADGDKSATATTSAIYLNGEQMQLTAYNIDGSNYFKLRDLGSALDFGVEYDEGTKTVAIKSTTSYMPETDTTASWDTEADGGLIFYHAKFIDNDAHTNHALVFLQPDDKGTWFEIHEDLYEVGNTMFITTNLLEGVQFSENMSFNGNHMNLKNIATTPNEPGDDNRFEITISNNKLHYAVTEASNGEPAKNLILDRISKADFLKLFGRDWLPLQYLSTN